VSDDPAAQAANAAVVTERDRPVTFRDIFSVGEYRAVYLSLLVNWLGDYLARAAITVLVYQQSNSVLLSAAAFAVSFLPWIIGGTLLSALAERYPYRRVMITADLFRMVLIALLLIPHLPVAALLTLLFLASLGTPPTQAARSALLPLLVGRDRLPIAIATNATTGQAAQVVGYWPAPRWRPASARRRRSPSTWSPSASRPPSSRPACGPGRRRVPAPSAPTCCASPARVSGSSSGGRRCARSR